jgi:hypothetical protein
MLGLPGVGWGAVIATFLITNLLGVHKIEMRCDADGYYPRQGDANSSQYDVSGLGEWGGNVNDKSLNLTIQNMTIKAAQYKASRLIGDMLEAQNSSTWNDSAGRPLVPVQIMTGRKEDVQFWQSETATNLCQERFGQSSTAPYDDSTGSTLCSGTKAGIWQNPQTIAWTHVGF